MSIYQINFLFFLMNLSLVWKGSCDVLWCNLYSSLPLNKKKTTRCVFFYGEDWQTTGTILKIYTAMMFFQFISTPLSYSIVLQNFQKYDLMLQIIRLLLVSISFIIGYLNNDFYLAIKCYVLGYVIYYLMHTLLQYRSVIGQK